MALRVRLLGRPGLEYDGAARRLEGHKTWALLSYLLLESRAPTRRELADLLWSETDDPLGAVRWSLSQVRKAINPPAEIGERDGRIKIDAEVLVVDADELLRGEWDEASIDDLVRGELLEGMSFGDAPSYDTWLQVQRARVATAATDALRWAATHLAHREPDRALALAERALRSEPFDDALHELIVEIHAERGEREHARDYLARVTRRYREELSIEPPPSIARALERAPRSAAEPLLRLDVQARALLDIARVRFLAGDFESARDISLRAARQAGESGDRALEARALIVGSTTYTEGGLGTAREWLSHLQRALRLANELGDRTTIAQIECERGRIAAIEGRYGSAEASFRRARRLAEAVGDTREAGWARAMLAVCHADRGEFQAAEDDLRAALPAVGWAPYPMAVLARVRTRCGDIEEGKAFADAAVTRAERDGLLPPLPWALVQAGEARLAEGDLDGATERFTRALTIAQETRSPSPQALALRGLGLVARSRNDSERAVTLLREALAREERGRGHRSILATILADLVDAEGGRDKELVEKGLRIAMAGPMPHLAERFRRFGPSHTVGHTVGT
ncbi:MAG TPA: tetratricopeptide repeat protein [Candidatus Limnocylindria bacterium]|jgi:DNA-binding SARP family transcriptional activator|nr:tetratricopeptide repeat protein [Candidatus Limnocylindria bacterium]